MSVPSPRSSVSSRKGYALRAGSSRYAATSVSCARFAGTSPSDLASCAVTGRRPSASTTDSARFASPASTSGDPSTWTPKRQPRSGENSWSSGTCGGLTAIATALSGRPLSAPILTARTRAVSASSASGAGAAASADPSASSKRRRGSRSSNLRNVSLSCDRSGEVAANAFRSSSTSMSRLAVASCLDTRAESACSLRFCLRLAPLMSSMWASTSSSVPNRCRRSAAVLSPIPGTPGMLSLVSPFRPMKSGISSGGMP